MRNTVGSVEGIGVLGIVRDVKPTLLPPSVWSDGRNVRFESHKCFGMRGVAPIFETDRTGLISVGLVNSVDTEYILYSTGGKVYSYDGTTVNDITRASGGDYTETILTPFDIQSFNGLGLLNNPNEVPQLWDSSSGSNQLVMLTNWDANWKCERLIQFKSFLVALKLTESATYYPHKMRWSDPAEAGAVPASWDETDATRQAGEFSFPDTSHGELQNGLALGDSLYVYKTNAIWRFNYIGGSLILEREPVVRGIGLYAPRTLTQIPNYQGDRSAHFFMGEGGFYIMDGNVPIPVFEEVFKNEIKSIKTETNFRELAFSVTHHAENEVWFCMPQSGETTATIAFCMNYINGTYSIRELSGTVAIVSGVGLNYQPADPNVSQPFSDGEFFSDGTGFAVTELAPTGDVLIEASNAEEQLFYLDVGAENYDGEVYECWVQREGLATVQPDSRRPETVILDYGRRKMVKSFVFKSYGLTSAIVYIGAQEYEDGTITWDSGTVTSPTEYKYDLPIPVSGRFICIKVMSVGGDELSFGGFDYEVELLGEY